MTRAAKEIIGKKAKRVLDHARLCFLRENGYDCSLNYYVKSDVTLENVCLVGTKTISLSNK